MVWKLKQAMLSIDLSEENAAIAHYYKGLTHLGKDELEDAEKELEEVIKIPGHTYT